MLLSASRVVLYASTDASVLSRISLTAWATSPISSFVHRSIRGVADTTSVERSPAATFSRPPRRSVVSRSRSRLRRSTTSSTPRVMPRVIHSARPTASSSATTMRPMVSCFADAKVASEARSTSLPIASLNCVQRSSVPSKAS